MKEPTQRTTRSQTAPSRLATQDAAAAQEHLELQVDDWICNPSPPHSESTLTNGQKTIHFGSFEVIAKPSSTYRIDLRGVNHDFPADYSASNARCFIAAADLIDDALAVRNQAWVHCVNGKSRTSFAIISYLTRHSNMDFESAVQLLQNGQQARLGNSSYQLRETPGRALVNGGYYRDLTDARGAALLADKGNKDDFRALHVQAPGAFLMQDENGNSSAVASVNSKVPAAGKRKPDQRAVSSRATQEKEGQLQTINSPTNRVVCTNTSKRQRLSRADLLGIKEAADWLNRPPSFWR